MYHDYVLMSYYVKYLKEVRNLSDSSVGHYTQALRKISKMLVERKKISETIYEIKDLSELQIIREYITNDSEFIALDTKGHQMYSAGLNNYLRFATGEEMYNKQETLSLLDVQMPVQNKKIITHETWGRSTIIKVQTMETAAYHCEINPEHNTFISKSSNKPYMEGHHAIPMKWQDKFDNSIDIYANVVCLCPICHRLLHYGLDSNKKVLLDQIYSQRVERLAKSGIEVSRSDFEMLAI